MQHVCGREGDRRGAEHEVPTVEAKFSEDGTKEIEHRVGAAAIVIGVMRKKMLQRSELRRVTTMRVYNAMMIPTMLYGCETWTVMKGHESRQQAMEMGQLRRMEW